MIAETVRAYRIPRLLRFPPGSSCPAPTPSDHDRAAASRRPTSVLVAIGVEILTTLPGNRPRGGPSSSRAATPTPRFAYIFTAGNPRLRHQTGPRCIWRPPCCAGARRRARADRKAHPMGTSPWKDRRQAALACRWVVIAAVLRADPPASTSFYFPAVSARCCRRCGPGLTHGETASTTCGSAWTKHPGRHRARDRGGRAARPGPSANVPPPCAGRPRRCWTSRGPPRPSPSSPVIILTLGHRRPLPRSS